MKHVNIHFIRRTALISSILCCIGCLIYFSAYAQQPLTAQDKVMDRPAVDIAIEFVGKSPGKVGDNANINIILTPNMNMDNCMLSISSTAGIKLVPPREFSPGESFTPFIKNLKSGDHFKRSIAPLKAGNKETISASITISQSGRGYIMASLSSRNKEGKVIYSDYGILYFTATNTRAFFSRHSLDDVNIQALRDSLTIKGLSKEQIEKAVKRAKRSGGIIKTKKNPSNSGKSPVKPIKKEDSYNSVTVQGTVLYTDVLGNTHPVRFVTVQIWDEEVAVDELVATTSTDGNGQYTSTFDDNDGDGTGRDIYVVVQALSSTINIEDYTAPHDVWEIESAPPIIDAVDGNTYTIDVTASNDIAQPQNVAFEVYEAINMQIDYLMNTLGEPAPSQITVWYPKPGDGSAYNGILNLAGTDCHDWDNIQHEYNHHIQNIYDISNSPGGGHNLGDNLCSIHGKEDGMWLAWGEAWPTFFCVMSQQELNMAAQGIPNVGDVLYTDTKPAPTAALEYSLEALDAYSDGEGNEISVQRALWDLYDNVNDNGDLNVAIPAATLWTIVRDNHSYTFSEFWNSLIPSYSEAEIIAFGGILADQHIGTQLTGPANGSIYAGGAAPTFQWNGNLVCCDPAANQNFSVRFYNDALTTLIWSSPWQSTTTFTPTVDQCNNIFVGPNGTIRWIVASKDNTAPATGVYYGQNRSIIDNYDVPDRNPVDIILVLDISGSMGGVVPGSTTSLNKITLLKQAVEIFIRTWALHSIPGDHMGIVYFSTNTSTTAGSPPVLRDITTDSDALVIDVQTKNPLNCTSIGGALQVAYNNFDPLSADKRVIILFSDGEQTGNPMVVEEGDPSNLKIFQYVGGIVPFGGYWCSSSAALDLASNPVVPDGQFLYEHPIQIHSIGVGTSGAAFDDLISRISNETDALHHFTSSPDEDLDIFFTNDLINSLKTGTLEIVKSDKGSLESTVAKTLTVPVNNGARSLALVLSWKGLNSPQAISMVVTAPDGTSPVPTSTKSGAFYTIVKYDFSKIKIDRWGNWTVRLTNTSNIGLPYQFSAIVDEPCFHYIVNFPRKLYAAGDPITLNAIVTQQGKPLGSSKGIWVDVTSPAVSAGNILSANLLKVNPMDARKYNDRLAALEPGSTRYQQITSMWLADPKNAAMVNVQKTNRMLLLDDGRKDHGDMIAGDGIYTNVLSGTQLPGNYSFNFNFLTSSLCGRVTRTEINSTYIGIGDISPTHSIVNAVRLNDRLYVVKFMPVDRYNNLLGPGHINDVQILAKSGVTIGDVIDRFDGSYDQIVSLRDNTNPAMTFLYKGKSVSTMKVSDLLKSGIADQSVTPKIKAISLAKGRLGRSYTLSIQGKDFHPWVSVVFSNPGIIVEDIMVKNETNIQIKIAINKKAEIAKTDVVVINPSGKGSVLSNAFNITK